MPKKNCEKCGSLCDNEIGLANDDFWDFCSKCICQCPYCNRMVSYVIECNGCHEKMCSLDTTQCDGCNLLKVCPECHPSWCELKHDPFRCLNRDEETDYRPT